MKVVVGMTTTDKRQEFAEIAMQSLKPQVDEIRLYNNDKEQKNYTDNAKFYWLSDYEQPILFLSCDDDIIYPSDYVKRTRYAIDKWRCIVTYHGRILSGLDRNYYKDHEGFSCLNDVDEDQIIDVGGTGVMAFRTDYFNPTELYKSPYQKMFDLVVSLEAKKQNKQITVINHRAGWLTDLNVPKDLTICNEQRNNPQLTEIANRIYEYT